MSTNDDLIQRLEKAAGPDRQLDRMIEETLPGVGRHMYPDMVKDGYVISGQGHPGYGHSGQAYLPPQYTASIDAALTLVPEGWFGSIPINRDLDVWLREGNDSPFIYGRGATPSIALCIAALKARQPAGETT